LGELNPTHVFVCGYRLWRNLERLFHGKYISRKYRYIDGSEHDFLELGKSFLFASIHPSTGYNRDEWTEAFRCFVEATGTCPSWENWRKALPKAEG
jgi:hypothetical protein